MNTVMAAANQKGGAGKTAACEILGVGLVNESKKVLLIDADPLYALPGDAYCQSSHSVLIPAEPQLISAKNRFEGGGSRFP